MGNALTNLLRRPTTTRQVTDYETVFDDFISFAGGGRIEKLFEVPRAVENADYYLLTDTYELIIELKQMHTFRKEESVDTYFSKLMRQNRVPRYQVASENQIRIDPESLSQHEWNRFYAKFRPSVTGHLDKASRQLKATNNFIRRPMPERPRYFGAVLMNSNDFNLSTDLLYRLVDYRTKNKWHRGLYSCLDFVTCLSVDLVQEAYHPLHCRHIVRNFEQPQLLNAVRYLFERWAIYGADGYGTTVTFILSNSDHDPVKPDTKVHGKLQSKC